MTQVCPQEPTLGFVPEELGEVSLPGLHAGRKEFGGIVLEEGNDLSVPGPQQE